MNERIPLFLEGRQWSTFESLLFNLVTKECDRKIPGWFSNRLRIVNAMLIAMDAEIERLIEESRLHIIN